VDEERGVYWINHTIMLLAMYSKTRSITRRNKLIPRSFLLRFNTYTDFRFLPRELGTMVAEYLCFVRPLEVFFSEKFHFHGAGDMNEFLWADYRKGIWDGDFLSDRLQIYTSQHGMHGLGLQEYRQVATAFMKKHLKYHGDDDINLFLDAQAGHSKRIAETEYAISTEDHRQITTEVLHQYFLVSTEWQKLLINQALPKKVIVGTSLDFADI
jgi:hypothetical protein